jgi:hypothetical protein
MNCVKESTLFTLKFILIDHIISELIFDQKNCCKTERSGLENLPFQTVVKFFVNLFIDGNNFSFSLCVK